MKVDASTAAALRPWFPLLDLDNVRIVVRGPVVWFVRRVLHQGAMTVAPFIFYAARFDPARPGSVALLAHELKHIEQYKRLGHARFLWRYLRDLASRRFRYSRDLPLEAECYALQAEVALALRAGSGPGDPA